MKIKNIIRTVAMVSSMAAAVSFSSGMIRHGSHERETVLIAGEKSRTCQVQSFEDFLTMPADQLSGNSVISDPFESTDETWAHPLTEDEFQTACCIVMGEAGGECFEGQLAVAQCLRNGCDREDVEPSNLRKLYKYSGYKEEYSKSVEDAVVQAFRYGEGVTEEEILFFYNPSICQSKWHESLNYILTIGGHRFFAL